jgi:hypothetical protein
MWSWLASILGQKDVSFTFDNSKRAERDLTLTQNKGTNKSKRLSQTSTKSKSKDTYHGTAVHTEGNVTVYEGPVNINVNVQLDKDGKISPETIRTLAPFTEAFEQKQIALVAQSEQDIIDEIHSFEEDTEVLGLLKFFRHRLNSNDFLRMRIGLYLKYLSEYGRAEEVKNYWNQVITGQRQRDRRIIELASTGYFKTHFRPLYKLLMKADTETAQKRFNKEFDAILEDMRFAIFISSNKSVDEIYDETLKKAIKNIKYGSNTEVISLYAAGAQQVHRVKKALPMLGEIFPVISVSAGLKNVAVIRVDITYRKNNIPEEMLQDDILSELVAD